MSYVWVNDYKPSRSGLIRETCCIQLRQQISMAEEAHRRGFVSDAHKILDWAKERIEAWKSLDEQNSAERQP